MSSPQTPFRLGDRVFMSSAGVGTVSELAGKDEGGKPRPLRGGEEPAFYVVRTQEAVACVPISRASETLRPLASEDVARRMLEALRAPHPPLPASLEPLLERGRKVVHAGDPLAQATFLRELFGLPPPVSDAVGAGLRFLADLVLTEVAEVLRLIPNDLEDEMRRRHPAYSELRNRQATLLGFRPKG